MGGGAAAGFLSGFTDAAKKAADHRQKEQDAQKSKQADIYWGVIKNSEDPEQVNYAQTQLQKLYPKSPQLKELFDKFGGFLKQIHPAHQQGGDGQGTPPPPQAPGAAPQTGAPPTPPQGGASSVPPPPMAPGASPGGATPMATSATPPAASGPRSSVAPPPAAPGGSPTVAGGKATSSGGFPIENPGAVRVTPPPAAPQAAAAAPPAAKTPKGQDPRFAEMAKASRSDEHDFKMWKRQQEVLKQNKIEEQEAQAKAKAQAGTGGAPPRPVFSRPTSVLDARGLAAGGKVYEGEDGEPIDVAKLPDNMSLQPFTTRVTETDDDGNSRQVWKTRYLPISPDQRKVTVGNVEYAVNPADQSKIPAGAGTAIGQHTMPTTTATTDPATGQTTVSRHTPTTTGATGRGGTGATSSGGGASTRQSPGSAPQTAPSAKSPGGPSTSTTPPSPAGLPPLDPDGHITTGATPQVLEGANQLLDGQDVNKIPAKTRDLSAALARQYGWEQGKFTPKEQVMLKEATTFLDQAASSPSLKVLDEGFLDRQKIAQVVDSVDSKGMLHRALTSFAAQNLTDDEAEFVRTYNQLVGTISGLGQLVRSGRATEATIERLKRELPNPLTTKDSADAQARLARLRKEVDVAMEKGTFTGSTGAASRSSVKPPPKPGGASSGLSDAAKAYLKSQGMTVP
jgi:hypothetical protein